MTLPGFTEFAFTHVGKARRVFKRGGGPAVVIMHEIPGITPENARLGERIAAAGFTVYMPELFGTAGRRYSDAYWAESFARLCISREFSIFARRWSSPVADWIRALCRRAHEECGGRGVGVIGMCMTGGYVLWAMSDASVLAPVMSQPSVPAPVSESHKRSIGVTREAMESAKARAREGVDLIGLRFTCDGLCPKERFEMLRREFGERFIPIEIDTTPGNAHGMGRRWHSVLTYHFVDRPGHPTREALEKVLLHFRSVLN